MTEGVLTKFMIHSRLIEMLFLQIELKQNKLQEQSLNATHLSNNSCRWAIRSNENSSHKQLGLLRTIEKAFAFPMWSLFLGIPYYGMRFFSSLPLTCAPGVSLPSRRHASAFRPFWWRFPLTTSPRRHTGAASSGQFIYQKDAGNSLRSSVVSALLGTSSCGKGPDASLVSHPCCCCVGGHRGECGGWCGRSVGLPAWLSRLLVSRLP